MGMIIVLLLAQAIAATAAGEAASPTADVRLFQASPAGRFLLVADRTRLYVLDATTLETRTAIEAACVAAAFDAEDRVLMLVDETGALVRLEPGTGREVSRDPLPGADFIREPPWRTAVMRQLDGTDREILIPTGDPPPSQAVVLPSGEVLYRSRPIDRRPTVSRAWRGAEGLQHENLGRPANVNEDIEGVLGLAAGVPLVHLKGTTGILVRGRFYTLPVSGNALAAEAFGPRLALSTPKGDVVYDLGTFRTQSWTQSAVRAAAFGPARGWAFTATGEGIHAWRPEFLGRTVPMVRGEFRRIAVDGPAETLFGVTADGRLRRWTLAR